MLRLLIWFFGPVYAKEMVEIARRLRYYLVRVFYGLTLLLAAWYVWGRFANLPVSSFRSLSVIMPAFGLQLFWITASCQYLATFLFVPIMVAGTIVSERESKSLDLVLTTSLSDREIVLGKLGSRLAMAFVLILSSVPVLCLTQLFGGVTLGSILQATAATLLAMVCAGTVAIYSSAVSKSALGAVMRTYTFFAVWLMLLPILIAAAADGYPGRAVIGAITLFHPPLAAYHAAEEFQAQRLAAMFGISWWYWLTFFLPLVGAIHCARKAVDSLRQKETIVEKAVRKSRTLSRIRDFDLKIDAILLERRRRGAQRTVFGDKIGNPLWLRARLAPIYDRERFIHRAAILAWAFSIILFPAIAITDWTMLLDGRFAIAWLTFNWIAAWFGVAYVAGSSLVSDRLKGIFEMILTTPLDAREIVDGTLLGVGRHVRSLILLPLVLSSFFAFTGAIGWMNAIGAGISALLICAMLAAAGVWLSSVSRQTYGAVVSVVGFAVMISLAWLPFDVFFGSEKMLWYPIICTIGLVSALLMLQRRRTTSSVLATLVFAYLTFAYAIDLTLWALVVPFSDMPLFITPYEWVLKPLSVFMPLSGDTSEYSARPWLIAAGTGAFWMVALSVTLAARWLLIRGFDTTVRRSGD